MKKLITVALAWLFFPALIFAQAGNDKTVVAIVNFTSSNDSDQNAANALASIKQLVTKEIGGRQNFTVLDHSLFSSVEQSLAGVTDEAQVYKQLSDAAQQNGGQWVVTGKITQYTEQQNTAPVNALDPNSAQVANFIETISFSISLIDVVTSTSKFTETYTYSSSGPNAMAALNKDYAYAACKIKYAALKMFPIEVHIIKLDEIDKHGKLKKVLVDQGESVFSGTMANGGGCGDQPASPPKWGDLGGIFKKKRIEMEVDLVDVLKVNGKDYTQQKPIGKLAVDKTEGADLTSCIVVDGDKEIMDAFNGSKNIKIKIL
jgi:hypothetical protein